MVPEAAGEAAVKQRDRFLSGQRRQAGFQLDVHGSPAG